mmetsp:Transcript_33918/g.65635  ORF Transcript_33918/g.65635 Transcript_33918/m.65635 type:complete len:80 (-) Transcript_33918:79-318(-)
MTKELVKLTAEASIPVPCVQFNRTAMLTPATRPEEHVICQLHQLRWSTRPYSPGKRISFHSEAAADAIAKSSCWTLPSM